MFARVFVVMAIFVGMVFLVSSSGLGQQGGQGKKKGGGGGWDPKAIFAKYANGKDYFLASEYKSPMPGSTEAMVKFAQDQGITDGKITFEKFQQFIEMRKAQGGGKGPGGPKRNDNPGGTPVKPTPVPEKSVDELEKLALVEFKKLDANGDGQLVFEEMDPVLQREWQHYDKDQNGMIDLKEFVPYFVVRSQQEAREKNQAAQANNGPQVVEDDLDIRPVVYRMGGKMPPGLPDWFDKLDTNRDGMVSLGEWRKGEKNLDDFAAIDLNNDGLLTPEEVLRFQSGGTLPPPTAPMFAGNRGPGGNNSIAAGGNGGSGLPGMIRNIWRQGGGQTPAGGQMQTQQAAAGW